MHWLMVTNKQRLFAMAQEFDLAPQQMIALRMLGVAPRKMSELAQFMFCDNSNITGIVDRLEQRELVRRESAEGDRRVKLIVLTDEGERMRIEITKRMAEPPPPIASFPRKTNAPCATSSSGRWRISAEEAAAALTSAKEAEAALSGKAPSS